MTRNPLSRSPYLLCLAVSIVLSISINEAFAERFRFQWGARLSASEQYVDNVNLSEDDKEHDWITLVTPGLTLSLITEETQADLRYDLSLVHYARDNERSTVRHGLTLSGFQGIRVSQHLTLDLDASLRISEDPFDIADVEEDVTRIDRGRYYSSTLGGRVNYFFGPEDAIFAGFTHRMMLNEESGVEDRREYLPEAGLHYWFNTQYGFAVEYSYAKADYDLSENYDEHRASPSLLYRINPRTEANLTYLYDRLDYDGPRIGYTVHTVSLGLSHRFSGTTSGSVSGGYLIIVPEEGDDRGDFSGSLSLTHALQRGSLTLEGGAGYRRQFFRAENLGLSLFARASLVFTYQIQERLSADLLGSYYRDEYQETIEEREDTTWRAGAGLSYTLLSWLDGRILYEYRQRESDTPLNEYVDNRVTIRFTASYLGKPRPL